MSFINVNKEELEEIVESLRYNMNHNVDVNDVVNQTLLLDFEQLLKEMD